MPSIAERIYEFNKNRAQDLVQVKYEALREDMFRFFRGTCHLFYEDLYHSDGLPYSPATWICGDLHLENFGSFKGDNREVYFDLNDFDESLLAPAAWELARMLTSIFVAFRSLNIEERKAEKTARLFITAYAGQLQNGKPTYIEPNTAEGIVYDFLTGVNKRKQRWLLEKSAVSKKNKGERLLRDPRHSSLPPALQEALFDHINHWLQQDDQGPYRYKRHYKAIDGVSRLAGTGSLGQYRYVVLLKSVEDNREKYRMIDIKQSMTSSLAPYVQQQQPAWPTEAARIVHVQQRMQNRPPALLSTTVFRDQPYLIQEMQPEKDSINLALLRTRYRDMCHVVEDMAVLAASAQLRSSGRQGSAIADELIDYGHAPQWQEAIFEYARQYATQVNDDFLAFSSAPLALIRSH